MSWLMWLHPFLFTQPSLNRSSSRCPDPLRWMVSPSNPHPSHPFGCPQFPKVEPGVDCSHRLKHNLVLLCSILWNLIAPFAPSLESAVDSTDAGLCFLPIGCTLAPLSTALGCSSRGWSSGRCQFSLHIPKESTEFDSSDLGREP